MNWGIIDRMNASVGADDELWLIGDICMGDRKETLKLLNNLIVRRKILIPGNHDSVHPSCGKAKLERWLPVYQDYFDEIYIPSFDSLAVETTIGAHDVIVCHMPYRGEAHHVNDKYTAWRPDDTGKWLIHGHVHTGWLSHPTQRMINLGVPVWNYFPVPDEWLIEIIEGGSDG